MKLRTKLLVFFVPLVLGSTAAMTLFSRAAVQTVIAQEVSKRGLSIGASMAREPAVIEGFQARSETRLLPPLQSLLATTGTLYAIALDTRGQVLAHTNVAEQGKVYTDSLTGRALAAEEAFFAERLQEDRPVMDFAFPVWDEPHEDEEFLLMGGEPGQRRRLGTLRLGLPLQGALETAGRISRQVFWIVSLVSALVLGASLFFMGRILLPIRQLARATARVGRGELGETVPVRSRDELGNLASSFNLMSRELAETTVSREALRESEERLERVVEHLPEGVCLLDGAGRLVLANPSARSHLELLAESDAGGRLLSLGDRPLAELLVPRQDGRAHEVRAGEPLRIFELGARHIGPESEEGWVLVLRDVTQVREVQERMQQQYRLAAVGQLAAGIAHDFNNLLTGVIGFAQFLEMREDLPADAREQLSYISTQGERAAQLIRQILDFSRRSTVERQPLELTPFIKEMVKLLKRTLPESIHLRTRFTQERCVIEANPTQIQQVITNLAVNARDAMDGEGDLRIELQLAAVQTGQTPPLPGLKPGSWARLSITDTGSGIPPEVLDHIYEPFFTTKPIGKGTGLGLAQVYGIVQQHGGEIGVDTQMGQGTTFTVYLPLTEAVEDGGRSEKATLPRGRGEKVLVVEDERGVREVARIMLEGLDYRVFAAADGSEARRLFGEHPDIALVLTDVVMPRESGIKLLEALRQHNPDLSGVLMSGYPLGEESATLAERDGYLEKPLDLARLAQTVHRTLRRTQ